MSDDEKAVWFCAALAALGTWGYWYWQCLGVARRTVRRGIRLGLCLAPPGCALALLGVLTTVSAEDVRDDAAYVAFYLVLGAAWVGASRVHLYWLGLSARDDAIERGNGAAAVAWVGGLLGFTLCYAGANIGNGPGWWVVLFSAWLATGTLAVLWWVLLRTTGLLDAIMIDRDLAAGWRGAGFLAGGGLVLGRAAAGDWVSAGQAVTDLCRHGWPALALLGAAIWLQRGFRPNLERPLPSVVRHGVLPGVAYCALAAGAVACLGRW